MRVGPNLYPAFERQEVVVHTPRHVRTFAELTDGEIDAVSQAWHARAAAARREGEFRYLHPLINEGRAAGAGVPQHLHVHLVPRWNGDVNFMSAVANVRVIPSSLERMAERYRAARDAAR